MTADTACCCECADGDDTKTLFDESSEVRATGPSKRRALSDESTGNMSSQLSAALNDFTADGAEVAAAVAAGATIALSDFDLPVMRV